MCGKLPHVETLSSPDNYSFLFAAINECQYDNGGCEQTCVKDAVGYHCECDTGFTRTRDGYGCQGRKLKLITLVSHFLKSKSMYLF